MDAENEVALSGGNTSIVSRIGEAVHRGTGRWTESVQGLLRHLEAMDFGGVPRVLGFDDKGHEMLSFLHGQVPDDAPWPDYVWSDTTLENVGRWLANYHSAVAGYPPGPQSHWWYSDGAPTEGELICHNDFAPYNTVFEENRIVGVIDWDVAGPANPLWDLAFCAWQWVPFHNPQLTEVLDGPSETRQAARLKILCESHGHADLVGLVSVIVDRVTASRDEVRVGAEAGDPVMLQLVSGGHLAEMERTIEYLHARWASLVSELEAN